MVNYCPNYHPIWNYDGLTLLRVIDFLFFSNKAAMENPPFNHSPTGTALN